VEHCFWHIPPVRFDGRTRGGSFGGRPCIFYGKEVRLKTILYIDGFNLYYSAVKGTSLRWLNPVALVARAFPRNQIVQTKFFTAKVTAMPGDPDQPTRQQFYWRALRTLPNMEIILGEFRTRVVRAAVANPPPKTIEIFKTEEKGSDVNLAAHLLLDGFQGRYDAAIVISGDSDLVTPIKMVRSALKKPIGVLNPQRVSGPDARLPRKSAGLQHAATFYQNSLTWAQLAASQFPATLTDSVGTFTKPAVW
jgi:uncharacterized LabA/DUF88 family protein